MMAFGSDDLPASEYPPLACCAVLDSRFSSRQELAKDVSALSLFDRVVQATSVDHGLKLL